MSEFFFLSPILTVVTSQPVRTQLKSGADKVVRGVWNELQLTEISISFWLRGVKRIGAKYEEEENEKQNRAYNYYNCKALREFTSIPPRTVSCRTEALPSGIDKRRGWNKFTPLSFLLSFCSLPAAQRSLCSPGWLVCGGLEQRGESAGWVELLQIILVVVSFIFYHRQRWQKSMVKFEGCVAKAQLICLLLTTLVWMQDTQSSFSFCSSESMVWCT